MRRSPRRRERASARLPPGQEGRGNGGGNGNGGRSMSRRDVARAFSIGCREGNLDILRMLPSDVPSVMRRLGVTKMPANRRVNELARVGLLERELGTGRLMPTTLTDEVLGAVDGISKGRRRPA